MRALAAAGAVSMLVLGGAPQALGFPVKRSVFRVGVAHFPALQQQRAHATRLSLKRTARPARPAGVKRGQSALELDIVGRINAQRGARGLRPLKVSRALTAAAVAHSHQMGQAGYFEHESFNGAPFWKRIERYYPARRGYWSVGENIFWESPDTSGQSAVHDWMASAPHRQNILSREWREVGVAAAHFASAPGAFGGRSVTIVTADFGVRR
jgi:uncharacterized protein YkwD